MDGPKPFSKRNMMSNLQAQVCNLAVDSLAEVKEADSQLLRGEHFLDGVHRASLEVHHYRTSVHRSGGDANQVVEKDLQGNVVFLKTEPKVTIKQ